jgi:hypothetical protein
MKWDAARFEPGEIQESRRHLDQPVRFIVDDPDDFAALRLWYILAE